MLAINNFLGNYKEPSYRQLVEKLLEYCRILGYNTDTRVPGVLPYRANGNKRTANKW
jgi:hypothetical protein